MENMVSMSPSASGTCSISLTAGQIFYTVEDYYTSYIIKIQNTTNMSVPSVMTKSCRFKLAVRVASVKLKNSARHLTTGNTEEKGGCLSSAKMGVPT